MKEGNHISNHEDGCITSDMLIKYIKGELSGLEKNRIERHISSCAMCSDELEGLALMENPERVDGISLELNQRIDRLTAKTEGEIPYLGMYFKIAASIVFIVGVSTVIYFTAFHNKSALMPNYAIMEATDVPPLDSSNDMMLKDVAKTDRMENRSLELMREDRKISRVENEIAESERVVKYIAPVIVDSLVSDEANVEVLDDRISEEIVVSEAINAEVKQYAAESIVRAAPASVEQKSALGASGIAKKEVMMSLGKSKTNVFALSYDARKEKAIRLCTGGEYEEAILILKELQNDFPVNDTIVYYASYCHYYLNQYIEAVNSLAELVKNSKSTFYNQAKWYYALALIGAERKDDAILILEQIMQEDSPFRDKAHIELNKLRGK